MTVVSLPLTNTAYGFPRGRARRIRPLALACLHITGNRNTARMTDLHGAARAERDYANRAGSTGPSAHDYVARDGWTISAIDWRRFAAWSNGDVNAPDTANAGIRAVLTMRAKGYNANEAYWLEVEHVGWGTDFPITIAQRNATARRIVEAHKYSGLPINRNTVHGHWQINGVDRRNCPISYAQRFAFLDDVIARAQTFAQPVIWGNDVTDDLRAVASPATVARKLRSLGVTFGGAINLSDLRAGLRAANIDFGLMVNVVDLRRLLAY